MALLEYAKALWEIAAIIAVQSLPAHKSTNFVARLHNRWIMASTPSRRHLARLRNRWIMAARHRRDTCLTA